MKDQLPLAHRDAKGQNQLLGQTLRMRLIGRFPLNEINLKGITHNAQAPVHVK